MSALLLALIHIYAGKLKFLRKSPRSRWLSLGSGVSVAYVFVHILPDLGEAQEQLQSHVQFIDAIEHHVYILSLVGMVAFYGLERAADASRERSVRSGGDDATQADVFWLHMVSFSLYNALIGYLLMHREDGGLVSLMVYVFAMALHFIVNDYSLCGDHKHVYDKIGRWILAGAVIFGWVLGTQTTISEAATAVLFAFLAGSIILNVLKEELPQANESKFGMFAAGALGYSGLLLFF